MVYASAMMAGRRAGFTTGLLMSVLATVACGSSSSPKGGTKTPGAQCDADVRVDGLCPGVPAGAACVASRPCSETCAARVSVAGDADLQKALSSAQSGTCLELSAGTYGAVQLPAGVSLVGDGADGVTVGEITLGVGTASVRGVRTSGIAATGGRLRVDRVLVSGAKGIGVSMSDGALEIVDSTIEQSGGFGVSVQCATPCEKSTFKRVVVDRNTDVGIRGEGADFEVAGLVVMNTGPKDFQRGRGVEIVGGSVGGSTVRVIDNADAGIVVFSGAVTLGPGLVVQNNVRGVYLQGVPSARLDGFDIVGNRAVGLGIDGASVSIIVQNGELASTDLHDVPVVGGGRESVGDGINWLAGSVVTVEATVSVSGSGRAAAVIDGSTEGSFAAKLGAEEVGIIVQNVPSPDQAPSIADGITSDFRATPVAVADSLRESATGL